MSNTNRVSAKFTSSSWVEEPLLDDDSSQKLTRVRCQQTWRGDLDGESVLHYLMTYRKETTTFVGLERFRGRLGERTGTFVLTHRGTYVDGAARVELAVVEGSGTGALRGLRGTATFASGPAAEQGIEFEFAFDATST